MKKWFVLVMVLLITTVSFADICATAYAPYFVPVVNYMAYKGKIVGSLSGVTVLNYSLDFWIHGYKNGYHLQPPDVQGSWHYDGTSSSFSYTKILTLFPEPYVWNDYTNIVGGSVTWTFILPSGTTKTQTETFSSLILPEAIYESFTEYDTSSAHTLFYYDPEEH